VGDNEQRNADLLTSHFSNNGDNYDADDGDNINYNNVTQA
jgi:hypothetical protein